MRHLFLETSRIWHVEHAPISEAQGPCAHVCRHVRGDRRQGSGRRTGGGLLTGLPETWQAGCSSAARRPSWNRTHRSRWAICASRREPFGAVRPKRALQRAIEAWRARGLDPMVGIELEALSFSAARMAAGYRMKCGRRASFTAPGHFPIQRALSRTSGQRRRPAASRSNRSTRSTTRRSSNWTLRFADAMKAADDAFLFREMARVGTLQARLPALVLAQALCR